MGEREEWRGGGGGGRREMRVEREGATTKLKSQTHKESDRWHGSAFKTTH